MNKVTLQLWEESNINNEFLSDGCSLHIDNNERNKYVDSIYRNRKSDLPNSYDRTVGESIDVFVNDTIYDMIIKDGSIKLSENSFQNLIKFEEIIFNVDIV
jgi:hypothetical protein